jgi:hypothetical protein
MFFFVQNTPELEEIGKVLEAFDFPVRKNGFAGKEEIVFFYNEKQEKGFRFNAHKFSEGEIPDFACLSPFLVCVGPSWKPKGLASVVKGYRRFFNTGVPFFDPQSENENIIEIMKVCNESICFPWGGFPEGQENEERLAEWLKKAHPALFSSQGEEQKSNSRLTS